MDGPLTFLPLHADGANLRLLEQLDLAEQVVELALGCYRAAYGGAVARHLFLDGLVAVETLLHAHAALEANDLMLAWYEYDAPLLFVAQFALLLRFLLPSRWLSRLTYRLTTRI